MKYIAIIVVFLVVSCKSEVKQSEISNDEIKVENISEDRYASFGVKISDENVISSSKLLEVFNEANVTDTIVTKSKVRVLDVCQAKGCWMVVDLGNDKTARVKFKDYAFFMPKDIKGKDVIINGKAFVNEMPLEELRHYAEDAGKSKEEIAQITESEKTNSFLADGVLLIK